MGVLLPRNRQQNNNKHLVSLTMDGERETCQCREICLQFPYKQSTNRRLYRPTTIASIAVTNSPRLNGGGIVIRIQI